MKKHWLETILKELHPEAYHWSRQCCSFDEDKAKDVLQLVYLKILEGKAVYKEKSQDQNLALFSDQVYGL
jgi:hypothetical protein